MADPPSSEPGGARSDAAPRWLLPALLALVALTFARAVEGEFVYDDRLMIERNPLIVSLSNVPQVFTQAYWDFMDEESAARIGYWRPLTAVSLMIGHQLGDGRPPAFHLLSIACHLLATAGAYALARRLGATPWLAAAAALLFGVHPVHVESVAWITSLNDPLMGALVLWTLERYASWRQRGARGLPWAASALFALALLAKESAVAAVPAVLGIELALGRGSGRPRRPRRGDRRGDPSVTSGAALGSGGFGPVARALGCAAIVLLAYYAARVAVFDSLGAGFERQVSFFGITAARALVLRVELLGGALGLLAWPAELALFRPIRPEIGAHDARAWASAAAVAAALVLGAWLWRARAALPLAAWLVLAAALAPMVARIAALGAFPLSDRYLYVPAAGFALLAAALAPRLLGRRAAIAAACLAIAALAARSHARIAAWHDERALFETAMAEAPTSPYPCWGLGRTLLESYRSTRDPRDLAGAFEAFGRAQDLIDEARVDPARFAIADDVLYANLGVAWCLLYEAEIDEFHDYESPRQLFEKVAEARPDSPLTHAGMAACLMQQGKLDEAEAAFRRALEIDRLLVDAHHGLGVLHMRRAEWALAAAAFERALELRPSDSDERVWLARALFEGGEIERARAIALELRASDERDPEPLVLLATAAGAEGDYPTALVRIDEALSLDPRHAHALLVRAQVLLHQNETSDAIVALRRACDVDPTGFEAHYNLGAILLQGGATAAALPYLERAYAAAPNASSLEAMRAALVKVDPIDFDVLLRMAAVDLGRGAAAPARAWLERARALQPDHARTRHLLGRALLAEGEFERAAAELRRASELAPGVLEIWIDLATCERELGASAQAIAALEKARSLLPPESRAPPGVAIVRRRIDEMLAELRAPRAASDAARVEPGSAGAAAAPSGG